MIEQLRKEPKEGCDPDVVRLVKPEGIYTIMYGTHTVVQNPRQLPDVLSGVFLETGENNYIDDPMGTIKKMKNGSAISMANLRPEVQYTSLFKPLEERQTPIYFADLCLTNFNSMNLATAGVVAATLIEPGVGFYFAQSLARTRHFSRRHVLQSLAAIWGLSELTAVFPRVPFMQEPSVVLHPEVNTLVNIAKDQFSFLALTLREVSIAHKLWWLMQTFGDNPKLGAVIGTGHRDTEERIGFEGRINQSPQDRIDYLGSVRSALSLSVKPESFYQIVECRFQKENWQVTNILEVPELKRLIA